MVEKEETAGGQTKGGKRARAAFADKGWFAWLRPAVAQWRGGNEEGERGERAPAARGDSD